MKRSDFLGDERPTAPLILMPALISNPSPPLGSISSIDAGRSHASPDWE